MTQPQPTGYIGNLTKEEEQKLKEFWGLLFKVLGVKDKPSEDEETSPGLNRTSTTVTSSSSGEKKKKFGIFGKKGSNDTSNNKDGGDASPATNGNAAADSFAALKLNDADDKFGQNKDFFDTLANWTPEEMRLAFWTQAKHDHPDALLLRFLRARKWDVNKALVMLITTMNWKVKDYHLDDDIMKRGDSGLMEDTKSDDANAKKTADDFMALLKRGESIVHGKDKVGRPICYIRVRLHHIGEFSQKALERYTVYVMETSRFVLEKPVETAALVFDMTDFGLSNMDYTQVKFMIKCFEANYPESLGVILIHKAPWIFSSIWALIKGWLDPVVAGKVNFTKNTKELENFIPRQQLMAEFGGEDKYEYEYVPPKENENEKQQDVATRDSLLAVRLQHATDFQEATLAWISAASGEDKPSADKRNELAGKLEENYWLLDPYVRARSMYDRLGMIQSPGHKKSAAATPVGDAARSISEKRSSEVVTTTPITVTEGKE